MVLKLLFETVHRRNPLMSELTDPALVDLLNWLGIELMQLLSPPPRRNHQPRFFQQRQVSGNALSTHGKSFAQFIECLPIIFKQAIQQLAPRGISERFENKIEISCHYDIMQLNSCM